MRIIDYLKDRIVFFIVNIILFIIVASGMLFLKVPSVLIFLVFCIWFLPIISYIIIEIIKNKRYYDEIAEVINNLDQKYLLPEVIKKPNFYEGQLLYDVLKESNKYMHERVKYYNDMQIDYREYIETWIHEIKTPIASTKLIIENNKDAVTDKIEGQIKKIEGFIEQVLYYSKSNDVSKDYIIKEFSLKTVVMSVVRKNSKDFINKKISLNLGELKGNVYSDIKWIEFILNQLIVNAIKYSKQNLGQIIISSQKNPNNIILTIEDNGVGIVDKDINRVFNKGFTGENGRKFGESTGIGLYLCKKLCDKLGLGISISSKVDVGTKINIVFPLGDITNFQ